IVFFQELQPLNQAHLKTKHFACLVLTLFFSLVAQSQTARIKGVILDEYNNPVPQVNVTSGLVSTTTNTNGFYILQVPAGQTIEIVFSHTSFKKTTIKVLLRPNEDLEFNPRLSLSA